MNLVTTLLCAILLFLLPSCTAERAKRVTYDTLQNKSEMDCRSRPGEVCNDNKQSYDDYQRNLRKKE